MRNRVPADPPSAERNAPPAGRPLRADARRNEDAVLEAAREVFLAAGVDAPARDIAQRAGVGIGTLYRRFPTRAELVAAVFRREIDACAEAAGALAAAHPSGEAVALWLHRYAAFLATKKGLAAALHSGDPAFQSLPDYFRARFEPALAGLLNTAVAAGVMRDGVQPYDLLRAIGNLSTAGGADGPAHVARMVDLIVRGMASSGN